MRITDITTPVYINNTVISKGEFKDKHGNEVTWINRDADAQKYKVYQYSRQGEVYFNASINKGDGLFVRFSSVKPKSKNMEICCELLTPKGTIFAAWSDGELNRFNVDEGIVLSDAEFDSIGDFLDKKENYANEAAFLAIVMSAIPVNDAEFWFNKDTWNDFKIANMAD